MEVTGFGSNAISSVLETIFLDSVVLCVSHFLLASDSEHHVHVDLGVEVVGVSEETEEESDTGLVRMCPDPDLKIPSVFFLKELGLKTWDSELTMSKSTLM
jgi:hypothetical protein